MGPTGETGSSGDTGSTGLVGATGTLCYALACCAVLPCRHVLEKHQPCKNLALCASAQRNQSSLSVLACMHTQVRRAKQVNRARWALRERQVSAVLQDPLARQVPQVCCAAVMVMLGVVHCIYIWTDYTKMPEPCRCSPPVSLQGFHRDMASSHLACMQCRGDW